MGQRTNLVTSAPTGMVYVPKGMFNFTVEATEIEAGDFDVQYWWEARPQRKHSKRMEVGPFYIDQFPVTTTNYSTYLASTNYTPVDPFNWLKNWNGGRTPPADIADVPVTY